LKNREEKVVASCARGILIISDIKKSFGGAWFNEEYSVTIELSLCQE
jgi:hypothetical protein